MKKVRDYLYIVLFCGILLFFGICNVDIIGKAAGRLGTEPVEKTIVELNSDYNDGFFGKYAFINVNGLVHRLFDQRSMNDVVKLDNGYLAEVMPAVDAEVQAEETIKLADMLAAQDIPFLYVQVPYKISKYDEALPISVKDSSNDNADALVTRLSEGGVPVLDLREWFYEEGFNQYDLFFKTDHHWTPDAAFLAYTEIVTVMEENWGISIEDVYTLRENYKEEVYEDWFLGSRGKRTGIYYGGVDDITLLYPAFETQMTLSVPSEGIFRTGSFKETIFDYSNIEEKDYFLKNPYHAYIGDEYPLVQHENTQAPVDKKLLIVKDSFTLPVQAFLSSCFTEIDVLDLRLYEEMSLCDYIEKTKPDMVMVMYNPYMLWEENAFAFGVEEE